MKGVNVRLIKLGVLAVFDVKNENELLAVDKKCFCVFECDHCISCEGLHGRVCSLRAFVVRFVVFTSLSVRYFLG